MTATRSAAASKPARRRNPRGQGDRLREEIIDAASRLTADPAAPPLTLRAVAREAGVAATSVYLHFDDIASLVLAVAAKRSGELARRLDEAAGAARPALDRLRARCLAYCEFGLAHPGHYQLMFGNPLPLADSAPVEQMPGYQVFRQFNGEVAECAGRTAEDPGSFRTATLIWQQLHGMVSLRISRPGFPWPPLDETVAEVVDRIVAGAGVPG